MPTRLPRPSATLTVALVAMAALLAACTSGTSAPIEITLAELVADQDGYDGEAVVSRGILHAYDDPLHYWIEDTEVNRVELVPHDGLDALVGAEVEVAGTFRYRDDRGRVITVDEFEVLDDPPPA